MLPLSLYFYFADGEEFLDKRAGDEDDQPGKKKNQIVVYLYFEVDVYI